MGPTGAFAPDWEASRVERANERRGARRVEVDGHEAMEQFVAEGIIAIGRSYPSTRDTAVSLLEPHQ